jgi:regulatory protein
MLETAKSYAVNALGARAMTEARLARKIADRLSSRFGEEDPDGEVALEIVPEVVALCRDYSLVDDASFAEMKVSSGVRRGKSRRAAAADMRAKGVSAAEVEVALAGYDGLAAALNYLKRRRAGPFAREGEDDHGREKALAAFLRNGFSYDTWKTVASMEPEEIEELLSNS